MPTIISCSRRTDIPAFYTPWLMARLRAGYCHTFNPFGGQVYRVSLRPEDVTALTFWTRNPAPMAKHLDELESRGYPFYYSMSILGYPASLEPHSPPIEEALRTFRTFSDRISPERMRWRYDPIILSSQTPTEYHLRQFETLASTLDGYTHHCTFSFVQFYGKTARNMGEAARRAGIRLEKPSILEQQALAAQLAEIARAHGMSFNSCCNDMLVVPGINKGHCVDPELISQIAPGRAEGLKSKPTRQDCGCVYSVDIGVYETCLFGCTYCYATNQNAAARQHHAEHRSDDTMLWRPENLRDQDLEAIAVAIKGK